MAALIILFFYLAATRGTDAAVQWAYDVARLTLALGGVALVALAGYGLYTVVA